MFSILGDSTHSQELLKANLISPGLQDSQARGQRPGGWPWGKEAAPAKLSVTQGIWAIFRLTGVLLSG